MDKLQLREIEVREGMPGTAVLVGIIVAVVAMILLPIGFLIVAQVQNTLPTSSFTAAQNTTYANIQSSTSSNFSLLGLAVMIVIVALILGTVAGLAFMFTQG